MVLIGTSANKTDPNPVRVFFPDLRDGKSSGATDILVPTGPNLKRETGEQYWERILTR